MSKVLAVILFKLLVFSRNVVLDDVVRSGLFADIRERGILNPPVVREMIEKPGFLEILAGNNRAACWQAQGHESIEVVNLGPMSKADALEAMLKDHILTRDMPKAEQLGYMIAYRKETGKTLAEVGAKFGILAPQVCKLTNMRHMDPEVFDDVLEGRICTSTGYLLCRLPRDVQRELAKAIKEHGLTRAEVENKVRSLRSGSKKKPPTATYSAVFKPDIGYDPYIAALQAELTRVQKAKKDLIEPEFYAAQLKKRRAS